MVGIAAAPGEELAVIDGQRRQGSVSPRWSLGLLVGILTLGLGLRLAVMAHAPELVVNRDSADFFLAGHQLALTGEFPLPTKRAPLYPLFLAGAIASFGPSLQNVVAVQHLLGLVSVGLTYALGALVFGRAAGLLAALGMAINGSLLLMEQTIVSETLFVPILLSSLVVLALALRPAYRDRDARGRRSWLALLGLAGLLLGLAALTRPVAQAILPLMALAILLHRRRWRPGLLGIGLLVGGYLLVVSPWLARNSAVHGFVGISSGLGDALYARTHRHDKKFEWVDHGTPPADPRQAQIRRRVFELAPKHEHEVDARAALQAELGLNDLQGDAALREASIQVIRQQPLHWMRGTLAFFGEVWRDFESSLEIRWEMSTKPRNTRNWPELIRPLLRSEAEFSDEDQMRVQRLTEIYRDYNAIVPVTLLFAVGAAHCLLFGWRNGAAILPLIVASQVLLYVALDGPLVRYRYAVQPLITLLAAGGLTVLAARLWHTARARPLPWARRPVIAGPAVSPPSGSGAGWGPRLSPGTSLDD